ncbi:MAG: hypothetical protein JO336_16370 [Acidobacteriia bacterium]|nr:hypothetical protein [Terriglobia bacterium]
MRSVEGTLQMDSVAGCIVIVALSFPVAFVVARGCLRGVVRLIKSGERRHEVY